MMRSRTSSAVAHQHDAIEDSDAEKRDEADAGWVSERPPRVLGGAVDLTPFAFDRFFAPPPPPPPKKSVTKAAILPTKKRPHAGFN